MLTTYLFYFFPSLSGVSEVMTIVSDLLLSAEEKGSSSEETIKETTALRSLLEATGNTLHHLTGGQMDLAKTVEIRRQHGNTGRGTGAGMASAVTVEDSGVMVMNDDGGTNGVGFSFTVRRKRSEREGKEKRKRWEEEKGKRTERERKEKGRVTKECAKNDECVLCCVMCVVALRPFNSI